jgi:hypothetical protein
VSAGERLAYEARERQALALRLYGAEIHLIRAEIKGTDCERDLIGGPVAVVVYVIDLDGDRFPPRWALIKGSDGRDWEIDDQGAAESHGLAGVCYALSRDPACDPRL